MSLYFWFFHCYWVKLGAFWSFDRLKALKKIVHMVAAMSSLNDARG
jgi:hypothetical protein